MSRSVSRVGIDITRRSPLSGFGAQAAPNLRPNEDRSRCDYYSHIRIPMRKIQLKDAKANLSAVVDDATRGKPSVITRHGKPEAIVLGIADWERLSRVPSFGRL